MIVLKEVLKRRPGLKLVLMSATLNAKLFSDYFGGAAVIDIPGRTFPVTRYYLEDAVEFTGYFCDEKSEFAAKLERTGRDGKGKKGSRGGTRGLRGGVGDVLDSLRDVETEKLAKLKRRLARRGDYSDATARCLSNMDPEILNYDLLAALVAHVVRPGQNPPHDGAVLVFLTGFNEIKTLLERLRRDRVLGDPNKFWLLPLHGNLTSEEQKRVFKIPPAGVTKIVISTNVAETSVTINDCTVVIDCGRMKETRYAPLIFNSCPIPYPIPYPNTSPASF